MFFKKSFFPSTGSDIESRNAHPLIRLRLPNEPQVGIWQRRKEPRSCPCVLVLGFLSCAFALALSGCGSNYTVTAANGVGAFQASSDAVEFGNVPVGQTADSNLALVNQGSSAITVSALKITGNNFAVANSSSSPITVAANSTYNVDVQFKPNASGDSTGQLTVSSSSKSSPSLKVKLHGNGSTSNPASSAAPTLSSLSCSKSSLTGSGSDGCTVNLSAAAGSGGLVVSLSSNNGAVTVPASVTISNGATSAGFTAAVAAVATAQAATLTASAGGTTQTFSIGLNPPVLGSPGLQLSSTSLNFGSVTLNTLSTAQSITLTSSGTAPLTINSAGLSGTGFSMSGASFPVTLNPGQAATLTVAFDPPATGSASGSITISDNASPSTATISLSGTGLATTGVLSGLSCATNSITGPGTDTCTVNLSAAAGAGGLAVSLASNNSAVSVPGSVTVPAGSTRAGFTATVSAVTTAQTATLTASADGTTQTDSIGLGAYVPGLKLNTTSLNFGGVSLNTNSSLSVTLTSSGTAPLTINSAGWSGAGFNVSGTTFPVTLNPGQAATLTVIFDPTVTGSATGSITISDNALPSTATISLSGTGQATAGVLSGLSCSQGSMTGSGSDACTVSLSAAAATGGLTVSLLSSDGAVSVPGSVTVPAGSSSLGFSAAVSAVTSAQTATLSASAGGVTKTYAINLGAAVPTLTLSATSLSFGNVAVSDPATQSITLTSSGSSAVNISAVTTTGTGFSVSGLTLPATLNPGQTATLTVQFDPSTTGSVTGQLTISSNSSTGSSIMINLSGTGSSGSGNGGHYYSTKFASPPAPENPISENGNWTVPSEHGDSSLWSDVQTGNGHAYGQAMPTNLGDPGANLTGTWGPSQTVTATVYISGSLTGVHEDELRLRQTIGANSITGYELNVSLDPGNPYANIVRWNGANGSFCTGASNATTHAVNGDVLKGTITGTNPTTITFYLNGTQILQWADNGAGPGDCGNQANYGPWQTGTPGMGFYNGGSDWSSFGFSNFTASDSVSGSSSATVGALSCASASMSGAGTDACTVALTGPAPSGGLAVNLASNNSAVSVPGSVMVPSGATSTGFTATVSAVTSAQTATLTTSAGGGSQSYAISLGAGGPALTLGATSVPFGSVNLNTPATQPVTLTSSGTAALTINSGSVTGAGFSISGITFPATLNPGQTSTLYVQFDPTTAGTASGTVTLNSNASPGTATVSLSGTGAGSYQVDLSWVAPTSSTDPVAGYDVYRAASGSSSYQLLNASLNPQTTYTDTTVQSGTSYSYYVESVDAQGNQSVPSNTYQASIP